MTFADLMSIPFDNVYNELDVGLTADLLDQGISAAKAGFSEWQSQTIPSVSIGFTFFSTSAEPGIPYAAPEKMRTNVMLTGSDGYDLGDANSDVLRLWLDIFQWRRTVAKVLSS